jgi:hypothetical protein
LGALAAHDAGKPGDRAWRGLVDARDIAVRRLKGIPDERRIFQVAGPGR